jgi:hypothetical protein
MNFGLFVTHPVASKHRGQINVRQPSRSNIRENVSSHDLRQQLAAVHETTSNGAAILMAVDGYRVYRRDRLDDAVYVQQVRSRK